MQKPSDDDSEMLKDGETRTVSVLVMDATQRAVAAAAAARKITMNHQPSQRTIRRPMGHQPGSLPISDANRAARCALYAAADKRLSERWRPYWEPVPPAPRPTTDRAALYAAYDRRLSERWREAT